MRLYEPPAPSERVDAISSRTNLRTNAIILLSELCDSLNELKKKAQRAKKIETLNYWRRIV